MESVVRIPGTASTMFCTYTVATFASRGRRHQGPPSWQSRCRDCRSKSHPTVVPRQAYPGPSRDTPIPRGLRPRAGLECGEECPSSTLHVWWQPWTVRVAVFALERTAGQFLGQHVGFLSTPDNTEETCPVHCYRPLKKE
jgi:hypothetical protein